MNGRAAYKFSVPLEWDQNAILNQGGEDASGVEQFTRITSLYHWKPREGFFVIGDLPVILEHLLSLRDVSESKVGYWIVVRIVRVVHKINKPGIIVGRDKGSAIHSQRPAIEDEL